MSVAGVIKRSVSLAIRGPRQEGRQRQLRLLLVQRPADDEDLPLVWGLPAASLREGESWENAVRRAARDKLGVEVEPEEVLREGAKARSSYTLEMRLYAARIVAGEPDTPQDVPGVTQYRAWRWGRPADLRPAAQAGSLCSDLYLEWQAGGRAAR